MNVKVILNAFRALDRDEPALPRPVVIERPAEPYRGAQYARAGSGEEWFRLTALKIAGQRDMFAAEEPCRHEWLRPDNGSIECAVCGASRYHFGD